MKMYKGFNKDMTCRGYQYEEGKTYETEAASLCNTGFHACERPLDTFNYYAPSESEYHEVEMDEVSGEKSGEDTKRVAKKITIGAKLSIRNLVDAQIQYVKEHCTNKNNAKEGESATAGFRGAATAGFRGAATAGFRGAATAGDSGAATAGNSGAATAGDSGAATAGFRGAATAGFRGAATAGDSGAATAGNYGAATAGDSGAATAGDYGAATAGDSGAATAGDSGAATSKGKSCVGKNGLAVARGNGCMVKGGLGSVLVIVEENDDDNDIKYWKSVVVDGDKVKADTWYHFKDGELIEVE